LFRGIQPREENSRKKREKSLFPQKIFISVPHCPLGREIRYLRKV